MLNPEVDSLIPHVPFDRRSFIKATFGIGFAAAVLVPAYRAQPKGKMHLPVIIVIHEIFCVHEHIADVCRRFAKLGYLAIALDLYTRQAMHRHTSRCSSSTSNWCRRCPIRR